MVLLNQMKMTSKLYQSIHQREHLPTYPMLNWMTLLLPLIVLQFLILTILMNLILNTYTKASKFGNTNLVMYIEPTKSPLPLNLSRFKVAL